MGLVRVWMGWLLPPSHGMVRESGQARQARQDWRVWHLVSRRRRRRRSRRRRRPTHANTKQLRRLLHGIGLLGSENEGGAAPEKTVTSLGRKGVLDLAKVNARPG
jgi:hypothetical protein